MTQRWGERFLHFRDDDRAISRMLSSPDVLLELEWYGAGAAYFRFDLAGAESVIRNARLRCSAASMQYTYDIKTIQHLLLQAGFDPGRSQERRVGKECVSPARSTCSLLSEQKT